MPDDKPEITLFSTFQEARRASAYDLARRWVDDPAHSLAHRDDPAIQLDELATMAALADWLTSWLPMTIHHALKAGASIDQVAAAAGVRRQQAVWLWECWSARQLEHGLGNPAEHTRVAEMLVDAALAEPVDEDAVEAYAQNELDHDRIPTARGAIEAGVLPAQHISKHATCGHCGGAGEYVDGIKDPFWRHTDMRSLASPHAFMPRGVRA